MQKTILLVLLSCLHGMLFGQDSYTAPETGQLLIEACEGTLYDSGGATADYTDDNQSVVILEGSVGDFMMLTFSEFDLENGFDFLAIYAGFADDGELVGSYTGSNLPNDGAPIAIPSNIVSIVFYSDFIISAAGYALDFSCFTNDQPPVAEAAFPSFSCNESIAFLDVSTGFPTSWNWDFGDGTTSTEQNPVHTYGSAGDFTITLEVCNDNGCDTFTGVTPINIDPENEVCSGGINIPNYDHIETNACTGILFDPGGPDGDYQEGSYGSILIAPTSASGITISFTEFNLGNDGEHTDMVFIVDAETHITLASYGGTELPNGGLPISFDAAAIIVYFISDHFNNYSGFTLFWQGAGTAEPPVAAFSVNSTTVPLNTPIDFMDESQNAPGEWLWNFGDGTTSALQNPSYAFTNPGTYEINLEVTNCNSSDTAEPITITVLPAPEVVYDPPTMNVMLESGTTLTENINVCNVGEGPLVFNVSGSGAGSGLGYSFGFTTNENGAEFSWSVQDENFEIVAESSQEYAANENYVESVGGLEEDGVYYLILLSPDGVQALELFQWIDPATGAVLIEQEIWTGPDSYYFLPPPMPGAFSDWLNVEGTTVTLEPNQCIDIPVTFDATELFAGIYEGQINISTNDPDQEQIDIPVTMTVTGAPQIAVNPQNLDFGAIQMGASSVLEFTITNDGTDELSLTGLTSAESAFALSSAVDLTLAPQTSQEVQVTFTPTAVLDYSTTLTLENNAGNPVLVNLSGSGVPAPSLTLDPAAFEVELIAGEDTTLVTNIGNVGEATLNYDIQSSSDANGFLFEFTTDFFGYEFFWTLTNSQGEVVLNSSDTEYESNTEYAVPLTGLLNSESYTLNLFDSFGDGALPEFKVTDLSSGATIVEGEFTVPNNPFEMTLDLGSPAASFTTVDPESGSVNINESQTVNINVASEGLATGTYNIDVVVATNDPVQPTANVDITLHVIAPVATDFTANSTFVCGVLETQFTDLTANTATSWNWNFGDGTTSELQNPTYTYPTDGVYTVTLISCNSLGCDTLTRDNYITVETGCYTQNIPTGHQTETITVCEGNVYDSGGPNGNYLEGNFGILEIAPADATQVSITFSEFNFANDGDRLLIFDGPYATGNIIGEYSGNELEGITITASSGVLTLFEYTGHFNEASGFAASFSCNAEPIAPFANFSITGNNDLLCTNEAILFADGSSGNPTEWFWDFGDGVTSNLENPAHTYAESGTYQVQLTTCNLIGCDTEIKDLTVEINPDCTINNIPDELYGQTFILGCNGSLFDSGGADEPHLEGILSSVTIVSPSPSLAIAFTEFDMSVESYVLIYDGADIFAPLIGTYTGTELPEGGASIIASGNVLTIYEYTGQNSTDNAGFALDYFCQQDFADPSAGMRISNGEMCDGIMSFRTPDGMPVDTWFWDFGDGTTSTEATPTHEFPHHGAYQVTLEACYQGDCSEYVNNIYSNKITPEISVANLVTAGSAVDFTGLTENVTHWNWDFGNGMTADHATPTIVYEEPGEYDIHIHMINMNVHETCDAEHTHRITVVAEGTTSTAEIEEQTIRVYPNPTREVLNIDLGTAIGSDALIRIYNMDGRMVRQLNYQASEIPVGDLSAGTYLLEIIQDSEGPQRVPFVKVK